MNISKRYFIEPVGGYGLTEEVYTAEIQVRPNSAIEFYIVAIDEAGNYETSKIMLTASPNNVFRILFLKISFQ